MSNHQVADLRNVALVGHGAVGKTTLADLMLFKAGVGKRAGSVDDGSSVLDIDEEEKHCKHSVSSGMVHFDHAGKRINVFDTPGYPDFIGQAIGVLQAVETALIVVSASSGVQVNTRRMFNEAGKAGLARAVVINKMDSENIQFEELLDGIQQTFGAQCVPLNLPVGLGHDFSGVVSTLSVPSEVPAGTVMDPTEINQQVMDAIVEADEALMERFLEGEKLAPEEISAGLSKAIAAGTLIPVFCVSAKNDIGVSELMDGLAASALPPTAITRTALNAEGEEVPLTVSADGPFVALVFKTRIDPFVSKMSYLKIYSGSLHKDTSVHSANLDKSLKIGHLLDVQGGQQEAVDSAAAGDIVVVVKMDDLHVGDTLNDGKSGLSMPPIKFPTPMIELAAEPKSRSDQQKISGALQKVDEEDQTFLLRRDSQTKELVIQGMSELHLQIVLERLLVRDKVEVVTHQPKIPYRETVNGEAEGSYRHKKQSGGSGQFGEVHCRVSPCPHDIDPEEYFNKTRFLNMREYHYDPDLNYAFVDRISGGSIPNQFIPAVEKGIRERMERGVLAGYQVQDVVVELFFGKDHPVDSNETAFKMAGSLCFRNLFQEAKPSLLEPIVHVEITIPDENLGDITSDLNGRRGRVEGMDTAPGGYQVIIAHAPLSEMMTYARTLSSMTSGQGSFTMELSHYDMVPPNEQAKIIAAAKKGDDEDE
ncbi:Elongation factor G [Symmachiella dynata]|uniref:Elongation factor G n=1 Tax=Symmachiella dynata TaxID=2527995 RepID=A0A517ZH79_9PLAN|nr:elongation factor G [Symmachiella dynata]QDU41802.1 Elongation factor G [Symmachiella dynata]